MAANVHDCRIPAELIPKCPMCGRDMDYNLRVDGRFVQDGNWHRHNADYKKFLKECARKRTVFLELGVGYNTPGIIKYPFWQMTAKNPQAVYICVNYGEAVCPKEIESQSICLDADIKNVLTQLR